MKDMADTLVCTPVPKRFLNAVWPDVVRVLEKSVATSNGKYDLSDVYNGILDDDYVLWVILDQDEVVAAITTRIAAYPGKQGMALDWIGGKRMTEWLPMVQRVMSKRSEEHTSELQSP